MVREEAEQPNRSSEPARARSWQIFQYIAGTELCSRSAASALADRVEDTIRASGWRSEQPLGTEAALAFRFGKGRRMVRQAGRILSARGAIQIRRGKEGGFFVAKVERELAVSALADTLGRPAAIKPKLAEARVTLAPILAGQDGRASALIRDYLDRLEASGGGFDSKSPPALRAERLTQAILRDFGSGDPTEGDVPIGSLHALAERYSSGLPVVIQAVRLLEDNGIVASRRGRCGGIFLTSGAPAAALRLVNVHLGSNGAQLDECERLVRGTNLAMIDLATQRHRAPGMAAVERALKEMEEARTPTAVGVRWYLLQRRLSDLADNPVLHQLVRSLAGYIVLLRLQRPDLTTAEAQELVRSSQAIVRGVASGLVGSSDAAHLRCQQVLARCW